MREFNGKDFPPFLNHYEADHTNCVGVETTLAEMTEMGYSLAYYDDPTAERRFPNAQFLRTHGNRRVFAVINFPCRSVESHSAAYIEVQDDQDAEALRQSLQDQLTTEVIVEELGPYDKEPTLDGFRWYTFDHICAVTFSLKTPQPASSKFNFKLSVLALNSVSFEISF